MPGAINTEEGSLNWLIFLPNTMSSPEEVLAADTTSNTPSLPISVFQAVASASNAAALANDQPSTPQLNQPPGNVSPPSLPAFAIKYAPLLYLHPNEQYNPGSPIEHLANTTPYTKEGEKIDIPSELQGKASVLNLPEVNRDNVFLCLNVSSRLVISPKYGH